MLVINPDECIDCNVCVPECPISAIFSEDELPEAYAEWLEKNEELADSAGAVHLNSSITPSALSTALTFEEIKEKEKEAGIDAGD